MCDRMEHPGKQLAARCGGLGGLIKAAMSNSVYAPRSNKKLGEKDSVANCQPTISELLENGIGDLVVHLHFSDWVFWTSEK